MSTIDITNLDACIENARLAGLDQDPGPVDATDYHNLLGRLQSVRERFSPLYQTAAFDPFFTSLTDLGESKFNKILAQDPQRESTGGLMMDIAQALLQRGERFQGRALGAFQEVVADLYDGFLSAEDRRGVNPPDKETVPPMVKFGNPSFGPYTWPSDATESFGLKVAIVNLPPANARGGLLASAALPHETAGHDILHADDGLLSEVSDAVRTSLSDLTAPIDLAGYWADRIDETASDVFGILNIGPAAGIGLVGYFRGLDLAFGGEGQLRNDGPANDPHPADILRGYLAAAVVRSLEFTDAGAWADVIETETDRNLGTVRLLGKTIPSAVAKKSAQLVAKAITSHPMASLENHALGQIQNWRDEDESIVRTLRDCLTTLQPIPAELSTKIYAAHLVAAATTAGLSKGVNLASLFGRMLDLLKAKHDADPIFGPLLVRRAGNIVRDRAYLRVSPAAMARAAQRSHSRTKAA